MKKIYQTRWVIFDTLFVILFLTAIIWASIDYTLVTVLNPVVIIILGCTFGYSSMFKDDSYIATGFYWFSQNLLLPRTKYNYLAAGFILILMGILSALTQKNGETIAANEALWGVLVKSPSFWIAIVVVIVFNGLVGVYNYRLRNRQNKDEDNIG